MAVDPLRPLRGRAGLMGVALALFAGVFLLRYSLGSPGDGFTFLYLIPICLLATDRGARAGLLAGIAGWLLFALGQELEPRDLTVLGYLTRAIVLLGVGVLCGAMSDRVRKAGEESERYFELSSQMLGIFTLDGRPKRLNRRWAEVLGWTHEQLMSGDRQPLVRPEDHTLRMRAADGGWRDLELSSTVHADEGVIFVAATDVTEQRELESARRQAEERFRVAFEDSATGMAVVALTAEHSGQIVEANEELSRVLGVLREQLLGRSGLVEFAYPEDVPDLRAEMEALGKGERDVVQCEIRVVRPDDAVCWVHLTSSLLHGDDGRPLFRLSQILDIDTRKRADEQLRHMADHDPLSWLFNRRRFLDELNGELAGRALRASRGAVLLIDLDNFKQVNDQAGHAVGDEVIKAVSLALVRRLRSGDVAGRLGGDEFGVLLRRVSGEEAVLVSHDLLEAVSGALAGMEHEVARRVTLSVGITLIDDSWGDADQLLARADAAMYEAKRDGGGRVALSADLSARV